MTGPLLFRAPLLGMSSCLSRPKVPRQLVAAYCTWEFLLTHQRQSTTGVGTGSREGLTSKFGMSDRTFWVSRYLHFSNEISSSQPRLVLSQSLICSVMGVVLWGMSCQCQASAAVGEHQVSYGVLPADLEYVTLAGPSNIFFLDMPRAVVKTQVLS